MKKKSIILTLIIIVLIVSQAWSQEEEVVLGLTDNWGSVLETENIRFFEGRYGYQDFQLQDGEYLPESATDLLLHFNADGVYDSAEQYFVLNQDIEITERHFRKGTGAAAFYGNRTGLELQPATPEALFNPGTQVEDFTIEFWMYPTTMHEGETVFRWRGSRWNSDQTMVVPQEIRCSIRERKLVWNFDNVFLPPDLSEFSVSLEGLTSLIPRQWHHHMIRFDSDTGMIEYLLDGTPEAITYSNPVAREAAEFYIPYIGRAAGGTVVIGSDYNGFLDEVRITKEFVEDPLLERYRLRTGHIITQVFDMDYNNSRLLSTDASIQAPADTNVQYYYRISNTRTAYSTLEGEWVQFQPGVFSEEIRGRFLQFMIELFPDGLGSESPVVSSFSFTFEPDLPPPAPMRITADPGNGEIHLRWTQVTDDDIEGYLVYYGTRPGRYFGSSAENGESPIDAGNETSIVIDGLENGQIYYFTVAAYDASNPPHISDFSEEISARPSRIYE
ncbi:MAG: LamG-like jellyroll fold domain-containing protein [Spirochaetia bacterium]